MEYLTVLCVIYNDGTAPTKAIYTAETADAAIKGVYTKMGQFMDAENVASVMAMAVNSVGDIFKNEHWVAPAV